MKTEVVLAIIAGGTLGLLIAFGIWKVTTKPKTTQTISVSNTPTPTSSPLSGGFKIILEKPQSLQVLTDNTTLVSGITNPNTSVIVSGEDGDNILHTDGSGSFNTKIDLNGGLNQIKIVAFDKDSNEADQDVIVTYSGQFQADPNASTSPLSYFGTVTDISKLESNLTDSIIQIKNSSGDIQQIKASGGASFVDTRNNTTKTISSTDVAIGDFLVALGYKDANNILNAKRIIVMDALKPTTRKIFFGEVTDASVSKITVKNPKTNETITVTPNDSLEITGVNRFSQIKVGDKIIVVGETKDNNIDVRTIEVIK